MWASATNSGTDATADTSTAGPIIVISRSFRERVQANLDALIEEIRRLRAEADADSLALDFTEPINPSPDP